MRKLRRVAQECDIAVIAVSQIGRASEKMADKRPTLADLSGSGGIEAIADIVMLLYREDYYNRDTDQKNMLEVNVAKNRNGETGAVQLVYLRAIQKIDCLERGPSR
jgi:replicative DNA helicase